MRVTTNQFAIGLILFASRILPIQITWFLIIAFVGTGFMNRDWCMDVTFTKESMAESIVLLSNGLPKGWPWGTFMGVKGDAKKID